jgi:flagellar motor switch protein FliN/FliY
MNSTTVETPPAQAVAAATAAVAVLPTSSQLIVGQPTGTVADIVVSGQAVSARFAGSAHGDVVIVVGQDLVEALSDSPMGALDLSQGIRPAIEAAAMTLGPVVVDPGETGDPTEAMAAVVADGGLLVPLLDGTEVRAVVAISVTARLTGPHGAAAAAAAAHRPGLDLLHDVEMEVTAELGRTKMVVKELLSLLPGAVIELDRAAGGPADLLVNGRMIARGEVVVVDENFAIRITEIVPPVERT